MPVDGQVAGPARASAPFVCAAGCQSAAGSYPEGTLRYAVFHANRRDPRPHVDKPQPWASYCVGCFTDMQGFLGGPSATSEPEGDAAGGAAAAATQNEETISELEQAAEKGRGQCDEDEDDDPGLAGGKKPTKGERARVNTEQRAHAMVRLLLLLLCLRVYVLSGSLLLCCV
jgi:hypothetical protein